MEWLECRLRRPGRVGPAEALGLAGMADGMAAGVGWDVEALGMATVVAMVVLTAGLVSIAGTPGRCVPRGGSVDRRLVSLSERGRARAGQTCGSRGR